MNIKKSLESRIRGWFPKDFSLSRNQRTRIIDHLMRPRFFQVAYGVMLSALLATPFGIYHSRVEPYITGYLWGYYLPIGYVGLLLGIVAVLYPRLNRLKSLRFSAFLLFIGLSLFLAFLFSPKDYFINLINGTKFSPAQIDVDFALGNSAVLGLSLFSIAFGSISFIRGWVPKEPNVLSHQRTSSHKTPKIGVQIGIVAFIMGFAGALLGAFGVSLGLFSGLGMFVWPILIGIALAMVAAVIVIRKKNNQERERMTREVKT
jgi:MFS family permease